jgi:hypothetical protein
MRLGRDTVQWLVEFRGFSGSAWRARRSRRHWNRAHMGKINVARLQAVIQNMSAGVVSIDA